MGFLDGSQPSCCPRCKSLMDATDKELEAEIERRKTSAARKDISEKMEHIQKVVSEGHVTSIFATTHKTKPGTPHSKRTVAYIIVTNIEKE